MRPISEFSTGMITEIAVAGLHRLDRIFEVGLWHGLGMRHRLARRQIGISARLALEGDAFRAAGWP